MPSEREEFLTNILKRAAFLLHFGSLVMVKIPLPQAGAALTQTLNSTLSRGEYIMIEECGPCVRILSFFFAHDNLMKGKEDQINLTHNTH